MNDTVKIITEPSIFVVGRQAIDQPELARFLRHAGAPDWMTDAPSPAEELVEISGRLCYQSFKSPRPGGNAGYLGHILEVGHGSVCEHAVWTIIITGVSRSLTHELVRHRVGISYSQLSQRFVDESDCAFVVPPALCGLAEAYREHSGTPDQYRDQWPQGACRLFERWLADMGRARDAYADWVRILETDETCGVGKIADRTLRRKAAREAARSVLPNATETKIAITANGRALRHLFELRGSLGADAEIRRLAVALCRRLKAEAPNLFADCGIMTVNGAEIVVVEHHKV